MFSAFVVFGVFVVFYSFAVFAEFSVFWHADITVVNNFVSVTVLSFSLSVYVGSG